MSEREGRHAPRVVRHFMVRYRSPNQSTWSSSPLRDFSRDGARLVCEQAFKPGETIELVLGLPIFLEPVRISAHVMWQKPIFAGSMQMSEHGISFASLDPTVQQTIADAVQRFLKP
jgi:hypothetical protein